MQGSALSANVTLIRAKAAAHSKPQFGRKERKAVATAEPSYAARVATILASATLLWIAIILGFVIFLR